MVLYQTFVQISLSIGVFLCIDTVIVCLTKICNANLLLLLKKFLKVLNSNSPMSKCCAVLLCLISLTLRLGFSCETSSCEVLPIDKGKETPKRIELRLQMYFQWNSSSSYSRLEAHWHNLDTIRHSEWHWKRKTERFYISDSWLGTLARRKSVGNSGGVFTNNFMFVTYNLYPHYWQFILV